MWTISKCSADHTNLRGRDWEHHYRLWQEKSSARHVLHHGWCPQFKTELEWSVSELTTAPLQSGLQLVCTSHGRPDLTLERASEARKSYLKFCEPEHPPYLRKPRRPRCTPSKNTQIKGQLPFFQASRHQLQIYDFDSWVSCCGYACSAAADNDAQSASIHQHACVPYESPLHRHLSPACITSPSVLSPL